MGGHRLSDFVSLWTIHPQHHRQLCSEFGVTSPVSRSFAVDLDSLDARKLWIKVWHGYTEQFEKYSPEGYEAVTQLPEELLAEYRADRERGGVHPRFGLWPTVLYGGSIDISNAPIVDAK
jgi:hypothetical protein